MILSWDLDALATSGWRKELPTEIAGFRITKEGASFFFEYIQTKIVTAEMIRTVSGSFHHLLAAYQLAGYSLVQELQSVLKDLAIVMIYDPSKEVDCEELCSVLFLCQSGGEEMGELSFSLLPEIVIFYGDRPEVFHKGVLAHNTGLLRYIEGLAKGCFFMATPSATFTLDEFKKHILPVRV